MASLLEIQDLHVSYRSRESVSSHALRGVSFDLQPGEILGVLGESGSGKSTLATALVKLLPPNGQITNGAVILEGKDLLQSSFGELRRIRGGRMALIFQEPSLALHPTMRVSEQVRQVLAAHEPASKRILRERTQEVFSTLFPGDVDRVSQAYPHQLSGGQRQRVLIAQAIACRPCVIIADEPTASLDPTTQMEILNVFRTLREKLGLAMIFITHNPALLSEFADRLLVLYGGRIVECGPAEVVLASPRHPYTKALFQSIPANLQEGASRRTMLPAIAGDSSLSLPKKGCSFEPRCAERMNVCRERGPVPVNLSAAHTVSCFQVREIKSETRVQNMRPLLKVENLCKRYVKHSFAEARDELLALDGVSFTILPGATLAVVGESGSGKSTLALCLAGLELPTSGSICFENREFSNLSGTKMRQLRPQIQLIFQDPANSLNPRWKILDILLEPLVLQGKLNTEEMKQRVFFLLDRVRLSSEILKRTPSELSGGQRQRLAVARALALDPKLLILDEALSALDCSVQAQMANLLTELQNSFGMTYLFITHDLAMAAHLADEIAVMHRGRIVERGPAKKVLRQPAHETTRQLLASVPKMPRATMNAPEQ